MSLILNSQEAGVQSAAEASGPISASTATSIGIGKFCVTGFGSVSDGGHDLLSPAEPLALSVQSLEVSDIVALNGDTYLGLCPTEGACPTKRCS